MMTGLALVLGLARQVDQPAMVDPYRTHAEIAKTRRSYKKGFGFCEERASLLLSWMRVQVSFVRGRSLSVWVISKQMKNEFLSLYESSPRLFFLSYTLAGKRKTRF